jgi:hypothetical protein
MTKKAIKNILKKLPFYNKAKQIFRKKETKAESYLKELRELTLAFQTTALQQAHSNPLNKFGRQCFSQADEDGITLEILRRIDSLKNGTFAEFGVGNGMENNTLILKALNWRGFWVGGEDLAFDMNKAKQAFAYLKAWVTSENIVGLAQKGKQAVGAHEVDVISLDFDGNDLHFVEKLLQNGFKPKLFIVEYNAKFPPPIRWTMKYDPVHIWQSDDYFGASLASFVDLFEQHGFRLVCCNSHTGSNAFFVRNDFKEAFKDIPCDMSEIYVPPRYFLYHSYGHRPSVKTIANLFS